MPNTDTDKVVLENYISILIYGVYTYFGLWKMLLEYYMRILIRINVLQAINKMKITVDYCFVDTFIS